MLKNLLLPDSCRTSRDLCPEKKDKHMEIKQLEQKDKVITFFGEIKSATVENAIREIVKINLSDRDYVEKCRRWAVENGQDPSQARLSPIKFFLSTGGGACYDGMALHDVIESSGTPVEVICSGKIMSMGVVVALGAKVRKAYRNTTFMIHQVKGLSIGTLREMEDDGLVIRSEYLEVPVRVEYGLTEKARQLQPILTDLIQWSLASRNK